MAAEILSETPKKRIVNIPLLPENNPQIRGDNIRPVTPAEVRELNARLSDPDIYFGTVEGYSMEPEFLNGDHIECYRNRTPKNGDVVHCMVMGRQMVKRYYRRGRNILLQSDNPTYADFVIKPKVPFKIIGVVEAIVNRPPGRKPKDGWPK